MADDSLLEWLTEVARKHGLTGQGAAVAESGGDVSELEREYERLGGDDELYKVLAAEDKLFRGEVEKQRAAAQDWQKDCIRELEKRKEDLAWQAELAEKGIPAWQAWYDREKLLAEAMESRVQKLGDKLKTEEGKELLYKLSVYRQWVDDAPSRLKYDREWLPKARSALEVIDVRLQEVGQTYEVVQQRILDTHPEVDNALEVRSLSLAERVERLRGGPKKALAEAQKKLEAEIERIRKESTAEDKLEWVLDRPQLEDPDLMKVKWKKIEELLEELAKKSGGQLEKADKALEKLEEEYEEAGGDQALLEQRFEGWKQTMATVRESQADEAKSREKREAALQERFVEAHRSLQEKQAELSELRTKRARAESQLQERTRSAGKGDLLTPEESAELQLLTRELERDASAMASIEKLVAVLRRSKENAELLIEKERKLLDMQHANPDWIQPTPKPKSEELYNLPLRVKYDELKRSVS